MYVEYCKSYARVEYSLIRTLTSVQCTTRRWIPHGDWHSTCSQDLSSVQSASNMAANRDVTILARHARFRLDCFTDEVQPPTQHDHRPQLVQCSPHSSPILIVSLKLFILVFRHGNHVSDVPCSSFLAIVLVQKSCS